MFCFLNQDNINNKSYTSKNPKIAEDDRDTDLPMKCEIYGWKDDALVCIRNIFVFWFHVGRIFRRYYF